MNKINELFQKRKEDILSIYFTAGFPKLKDTGKILAELVKAGVDMIEIGIPFSDPLADGLVIQHSGEMALKNGMSLKILFEQLKKSNDLNQKSKVPLILMGYLNPVLQFGVENFCRRAHEVGISGIILPDLPMDEYLRDYKSTFDKYDLKNIFLITPQTSEKRIRFIDEHSDGFIYMVSSSSTTGVKKGGDAEKGKYFSRIKAMKLKNPLMVGFGIGDRKSFNEACEYASGAIIGSAFISHLQKGRKPSEFIRKIRV